VLNRSYLVKGFEYLELKQWFSKVSNYFEYITVYILIGRGIMGVKCLCQQYVIYIVAGSFISCEKVHGRYRCTLLASEVLIM
jgi:hypothetical protein